MSRTKSLWVRSAGMLLLLFLIGNVGSMTWRWGRPYLLGDPLADFPRVFLWAWERPENLEYLDPRQAGVAVLAMTLTLEDVRVTARPRMQPIRLPEGICAIAVIRIETGSSVLHDRIRRETIRHILDTAAATGAAGIQIDFDAVASERPFYRNLLAELRPQLPPGMKLSITALTSWCLYDDWISGLPVDEAVPMLFRMGAGDAAARRLLRSGDFRAARSRFSIGVSLDELPPRVPGGRRIYIFNPKSWTRESVNDALRVARELQ